jgi:hypothetical protein
MAYMKKKTPVKKMQKAATPMKKMQKISKPLTTNGTSGRGVSRQTNTNKLY